MFDFWYMLDDSLCLCFLGVHADLLMHANALHLAEDFSIQQCSFMQHFNSTLLLATT